MSVRNSLIKQLGLYGLDCSVSLYNPRDKGINVNNYIWYYLNKLQGAFKWDLEGTQIYEKNLNLYLFTQGYAGIIEHNGTLKCLFGTLQGELDENYEYKYFRVVNPYTKKPLDKVYTVGEDVAIIYNDSLHIGVLPLLEKYARLLVENELSLYIAMINTRNQFLISAQDDVTLKSANNYLKNLEAGDLGAVGEAAFMDSLKTAPLGEYNNFTYILEAESYLTAALLHEIGINANKDQKRESLASEEVSVNNLSLLPQIYDWKRCREAGNEEVKRLFGKDLNPKLNSSWDLVDKEAEMNAEEDEQTEEAPEEKEEEGGDNGSKES